MLILITIVHAINRKMKDPESFWSWYDVKIPKQQFDDFREILNKAEPRDQEAYIEIPVDLNKLREPTWVDIFWRFLWKLTH